MFDAAAGTLISDGGLATELEARGHDLSDALWSARLLLDDPAAIREVHAAYFRAGAVIATTASYQASFDGFAARGLDHARTTRLLHRSVELAHAARDEVAGDGRRRWIAASIGPYGAALADGSEYRGRYGLGVGELRAWHRPRLEALTAAEPDVFALETIPDIDEAVALVELVTELRRPAWLSYTIDGDRTRAGQPLADAFAVAADSPWIVAVGVNCCRPADVAPALVRARRGTAKPAVAYPNSGEGWDPARHTWTGPATFAEELLPHWISLGATVIGGCCRVGPAQIARLAATAGRSTPPRPRRR
ncbi:homocysteine S-methyltransferase [Nocardia sp. CDC159]|uniref:S-methylmethionine:homocysteine methyltransferase n=1 Tax=Nocardia pulmonis TaxID=2951408 RepID=A0A9X2EH72_9NOCA|nr:MULTISPECIES: homocysteine S-methyltransferase [Nocardia]MCM6778153.1 homocysteine S-methyltransferase [Nocardia pulmonis]MCM6791042.1 homocysteine S-methyltransferase [Nocardia sp. CDC159]